MLVQKILNSSVCLCENEQHEEKIIFGKGIGFRHKKGEMIERDEIEKVFVLENNQKKNSLLQVLEGSTPQQVEITNEIVEYAKKKLNREFDDGIYITLLDHIHFLMERIDTNTYFPNYLTWEIRKFYPDVYEAAMFAVDMINFQFHSSVPSEEAGSIAFHLINALTDEQELAKTAQIIELVKNFLNIIRFHFKIDFDESSLNYTRLITHLHYFSMRILENKEFTEDEYEILEKLKVREQQSYLCAIKIVQYAQSVMSFKISDNELAYLTLHIARVCK